MAEQRLQAELAESKMEIQRLRERLSIAMPTVHKDLSLISLVPKWSGLESGVPLEEFFSSIEGSALIGRWEQSDMIRIAVLKLTGAAKLFYNGCPELHAEDVTWGSFKRAFTRIQISFFLCSYKQRDKTKTTVSENSHTDIRDSRKK